MPRPTRPDEIAGTEYTAEWLQRTKVASIPVVHAAPLLGAGRHTVARAVREGSIPAIQLGRKMLIPRQVLLDLLHLPDLSDVVLDDRSGGPSGAPDNPGPNTP